jgi:hypothetical protein
MVSVKFQPGCSWLAGRAGFSATTTNASTEKSDEIRF